MGALAARSEISRQQYDAYIATAEVTRNDWTSAQRRLEATKRDADVAKVAIPSVTACAPAITRHGDRAELAHLLAQTPDPQPPGQLSNPLAHRWIRFPRSRTGVSSLLAFCIRISLSLRNTLPWTANQRSISLSGRSIAFQGQAWMGSRETVRSTLACADVELRKNSPGRQQFPHPSGPRLLGLIL